MVTEAALFPLKITTNSNRSSTKRNENSKTITCTITTIPSEALSAKAGVRSIGVETVGVLTARVCLTLINIYIDTIKKLLTDVEVNSGGK